MRRWGEVSAATDGNPGLKQDQTKSGKHKSRQREGSPGARLCWTRLKRKTVSFCYFLESVTPHGCLYWGILLTAVKWFQGVNMWEQIKLNEIYKWWKDFISELFLYDKLFCLNWTFAAMKKNLNNTFPVKLRLNKKKTFWLKAIFCLSKNKLKVNIRPWQNRANFSTFCKYLANWM